MIKREGRKIVISCDGCGVICPTKLRDFQFFSYKYRWEEARGLGWLVSRGSNKEQWKHYCAECASDIADSLNGRKTQAEQSSA